MTYHLSYWIYLGDQMLRKGEFKVHNQPSLKEAKQALENKLRKMHPVLGGRYVVTEKIVNPFGDIFGDIFK